MDKQSSPHIPNNWTSGIDYANYPNSIFYLYDQPTIIATIGLSLATAAHVGIVFSTITAISILIYIRLIYIIYFTEKLWSRPAYRLIVNKGVFDILYLFGYFIAGWCSIFDTRINYWLIKIIGALMLTIVGGFPMTLLLALNRILQMVFIKYYVNRVFSDCLLKLYLVICWLIALLMLALFASPLVDFIYFPLINFWQIVTNVQYPALNVINYIVEYAVIFTYGTTGVIYFMLLVFIIIKKNKLEVDEIRLTFQLAGTVLFGLISASWNLWVLTASTLATTYMHIIVASILNICVPGVDPFLYSIFNQTIRRRMVPLWKKNTVEVRFNV